MLFLSSAGFLFKITFSKNAFRNTIRVSISLDLGQARRLVGPDLGTNCLQGLSTDGTRRQSGKSHSQVSDTRPQSFLVKTEERKRYKTNAIHFSYVWF